MGAAATTTAGETRLFSSIERRRSSKIRKISHNAAGRRSTVLKKIRDRNVRPRDVGGFRSTRADTAVIFNAALERDHGQTQEKKNAFIIDTGATEINSTLFDRPR